MSTHKTIYLKASTRTALIADIAQLFEGYDGDIEFSKVEDLKQYSGHWIGQIPNETNPETGEVISWLDGFHANLLVPIDFDESILNCVIPGPQNPKYEFA